jgi:type IV secretory pathway VirB2 component (pilin)
MATIAKTLSTYAYNRTSSLAPCMLAVLLVGALFVLMPQYAFAQDLIGSKAEKALEWIKTAVHTILVVSVIGSGVLAAFGRMSWATVGQVLIGAVVAGVATEVVDALYATGG